MLNVHLFVIKEFKINNLAALVLKKYLKGGTDRYARIVHLSGNDQRIKIEVRTEDDIHLVLAVGHKVSESQAIMELCDQEFKTNNHYLVSAANVSEEIVATSIVDLINKTLADPYEIDRKLSRYTSIWADF